MSINKIRSSFYGLARLLGDLNAIQKGRIGKRIVRRVVGKGIGRMLMRWLR